MESANTLEKNAGYTVSPCGKGFVSMCFHQDIPRYTVKFLITKFPPQGSSSPAVFEQSSSGFVFRLPEKSSCIVSVCTPAFGKTIHSVEVKWDDLDWSLFETPKFQSSQVPSHQPIFSTANPPQDHQKPPLNPSLLSPSSTLIHEPSQKSTKFQNEKENESENSDIPLPQKKAVTKPFDSTQQAHRSNPSVPPSLSTPSHAIEPHQQTKTQSFPTFSSPQPSTPKQRTQLQLSNSTSSIITNRPTQIPPVLVVPIYSQNQQFVSSSLPSPSPTSSASPALSSKTSVSNAITDLIGGAQQQQTTLPTSGVTHVSTLSQNQKHQDHVSPKDVPTTSSRDPRLSHKPLSTTTATKKSLSPPKPHENQQTATLMPSPPESHQTADINTMKRGEELTLQLQPQKESEKEAKMESSEETISEPQKPKSQKEEQPMQIDDEFSTLLPSSLPLKVITTSTAATAAAAADHHLQPSTDTISPPPPPQPKILETPFRKENEKESVFKDSESAQVFKDTIGTPAPPPKKGRGRPRKNIIDKSHNQPNLSTLPKSMTTESVFKDTGKEGNEKKSMEIEGSESKIGQKDVSMATTTPTAIEQLIGAETKDAVLSNFLALPTQSPITPQRAQLPPQPPSTPSISTLTSGAEIPIPTLTVRSALRILLSSRLAKNSFWTVAQLTEKLLSSEIFPPETVLENDKVERALGKLVESGEVKKKGAKSFGMVASKRQESTKLGEQALKKLEKEKKEYEKKLREQQEVSLKTFGGVAQPSVLSPPPPLPANQQTQEKKKFEIPTTKTNSHSNENVPHLVLHETTAKAQGDSSTPTSISTRVENSQPISSTPSVVDPRTEILEFFEQVKTPIAFQSVLEGMKERGSEISANSLKSRLGHMGRVGELTTFKNEESGSRANFTYLLPKFVAPLKSAKESVEREKLNEKEKGGGKVGKRTLSPSPHKIDEKEIKEQIDNNKKKGKFMFTNLGEAICFAIQSSDEEYLTVKNLIAKMQKDKLFENPDIQDTRILAQKLSRNSILKFSKKAIENPTQEDAEFNGGDGKFLFQFSMPESARKSRSEKKKSEFPTRESENQNDESEEEEEMNVVEMDTDEHILNEKKRDWGPFTLTAVTRHILTSHHPTLLTAKQIHSIARSRKLVPDSRTPDHFSVALANLHKSGQVRKIELSETQIAKSKSNSKFAYLAILEEVGEESEEEESSDENENEEKGEDLNLERMTKFRDMIERAVAQSDSTTDKLPSVRDQRDLGYRKSSSLMQALVDRGLLYSVARGGVFVKNGNLNTLLKKLDELIEERKKEELLNGEGREQQKSVESRTRRAATPSRKRSRSVGPASDEDETSTISRTPKKAQRTEAAKSPRPIGRPRKNAEKH